MSWIDWLIVIIPVAFVIGIGLWSRRYVRSVADYLAAGRICGRYVISVGDIANALSIIGLVAYVEVQYKTGYALSFWNNIMLPLGIILSLTGYCTYRFRETKAMSLGQFLEMRYSRAFRVFAAFLRSIAEMLANMIMPAIAARFFIYILDLPRSVSVLGFEIPTFMILVTICLTIAISIICMGGTLALVITDAIQGILLYPLMVVFTVFVLVKFSWSQEIVPVMMDRAAGESFLNPYDISKLRDFNLFFLVVTVFTTIIHRASWIGAGTSTAAKSPHEQKMASLLGTWRGALNGIFYVLIAVMILTVMNHKNFAPMAKEIRTDLCQQVAKDVAGSEIMQKKINQKLAALPPLVHEIGKDAPLSDSNNLDTVYLNVVHKTLLEGERTPTEQAAHIAKITDGMDEAQKAEALKNEKLDRETAGHSKFQQFRTLYHQLLLASTMRKLLPTGLLGLFMLLLVMAMISTDDTRIYSASLTIAQDVILPLRKKDFTPEQHVLVIRLTSIGVGVFFFFGSFFMAQLDYINLFVTIVCTMWQGGCGPVMIFGLYSRFGTTAGAWTSLLSGMFLAFFAIFIQRQWANLIYPFLQRNELVESVGSFLESVSKPFNPYIEWKMNPVKCPINAYEFYFLTMVITLILYVVVSKLTCKEPFNLDRMLHRGKYNLDGENKEREPWNLKTIFRKLLSITPEYTKGDRFIAWFFFIYSFVYGFILAFIVILIWNAISPWPTEWWGHYFFIRQLLIPGIFAFISTFWFGIGGVVDLFRLFRDLERRVVNHLDDGRVSGSMSLADKAELEAVDAADKAEEEKK